MLTALEGIESTTILNSLFTTLKNRIEKEDSASPLIATQALCEHQALDEQITITESSNIHRKLLNRHQHLLETAIKNAPLSESAYQEALKHGPAALKIEGMFHTSTIKNPSSSKIQALMMALRQKQITKEGKQ